MANIVTRNQPQGRSQVNWSNPIARGLTLASTPPSVETNAVTSSAALESGALLISAGPSGQYVSGTGYVNYGNNNSIVAPGTSGLTILAILNLSQNITPNGSDGGGGNLAQRIGGVYNWNLEWSSPAQCFYFGGPGSSQQVQYPTTVVDGLAPYKGKDNILVGRYDGATSNIYIGGVLKASAVAANGAFPNSGDNISIFKNLVSSSCPLVLIWNRALSDVEIAAISANPWQLFKPQERWRFQASRPARRIPTTRPCRNQPQSTVTPQLNLGNRLNQGALAIVSGALPVNIVSGKQMTVAGAGVLQLATPNGVAFSFRKNHYRETEILPAISTQTAVEFWVGYPIDLQPLASVAEAGFITGSANNAMGICLRQRTPSNNWGSVISWSTLSDSGEVLTLNKFTVLVSVRDQTGTRLYHDGVLKSTTAGAPASWGATTFILGSFIEDLPYWTTSNDTLLAGRLINNWSDADVKSFSANPWQLFKEQS